MNQSKFSSRLVAGILVGLFFGIAFYFRAVPPHDHVIVGDWIKFTSVDAYYHMRIVDNLVYNFPHLSYFDPYVLYPGGGVAGLAFFDYFLAFVIWLLGFGSPSQHLVDMVGVYFPAILGALVVVPVYFTGKGIFGRWAGVLAAGLVAIYPGEFMGRSLLGYTDHHVAEVLFTCITMAFLVYAVKSGRDAGNIVECITGRSWGRLYKLLLYSVLTGIFLGIYFLTWQGALLFVFIIFVFLIIQLIIDHMRGVSTGYLGVIGIISFGVALLLFLPTHPATMHMASLAIGIVAPALLAGISYVMSGRKMNVLFYPIIVVALGVLGLVGLRIVAPNMYIAMVGQLLGIFSWPIGTTVYEMQPILYPGGNFSWTVILLNFTTGTFISVIGLIVLIWQVPKRGDGERVVLIVWSIVTLMATLAMRRFAYYYVVNVALLTGYVSWLVLEFAGFGKVRAQVVEEKGKSRKKRSRVKKQQSASAINMGLAAIIVFFLVFYPNVGPLPNVGTLPAGTKLAFQVTRQPQFAPSNGWMEALDWMKANTPEPFGDADYYYQKYEAANYKYPDTAYGVVCWWDYGYWVTRIGQRIPISNPGSGQNGEAFLFTAQDENAASGFMNNRGAKYIITDYQTAIPKYKFYAVGQYSGQGMGMTYDVYYNVEGERLVPMLAYYPEYYRCFISRLYNFDGKEVKPSETTVISYKETQGPDGVIYKVIENSQQFKTYQEAQRNVETSKSENVRVIGTNPLVSPVPLEPLKNYKMVYGSKQGVDMAGIGRTNEIKIFEYTGFGTNN